MKPCVESKIPALRARRRGSIAVFVALALVVLLVCGGFAVNYGLLAADANRVQRACDAAAMAGVYDLGTTLKYTSATSVYTDEARARAVAKDVAAKNGLTLNDSDIVFDTSGTRIAVQGTSTRQFFFNKFMGRDSSTVTRRASAGLAPVGSMSSMGGGRTGSVAPVGITWETYNAYQNAMDPSGNRPTVELTLIRQNKDVFKRDPNAIDADPFVLFDLRDSNAKSGAHMQDQLTGDEVEEAKLGDLETTLDAALNSEGPKLQDAVNTLITKAKSAPWNDNANLAAQNAQAATGNIGRDNPRVINLIVTPATSDSKNGTFNTEIQGFAPVYIQGIEEETVSGVTVLRLQVTFLPPSVISGDVIVPGTGSQWSGNYVTTMLE